MGTTTALRREMPDTATLRSRGGWLPTRTWSDTGEAGPPANTSAAGPHTEAHWMAHLVTFRTAAFDPRVEPANPYNPIAGHAVLGWLVHALRAAGYQAGDPDAEDWGWYTNVSAPGAAYLVGASGEAEPDDEGAVEWTIQIHRQRSLGDKLFGRNTMVPDDALTALIERVIRAEPGFSGVVVDRAGP